ncbi:OCIA domain-containing protein asrij [Rhodnius prolixus]|uniref:OCIA domain-containing protein asrij n=1 Tax=Rhodnius prolixus TaxID=13249 RepID=UPI003D18A541
MTEPPPQTPYKFSHEELRVLEQCNRESFYQRCIPLATILGISTYYGVKTGSLLPNPRFGPTPKVFGAIVVGYLIGKLSYQGKCAEKLMALPNSRLGAMLRNKKAGKHGPLQDPLETEHPDPNTLYGKVPSSDFYSDVKQKSYMDIDTDRPNVAGLDDTFRPNVDDGLPPGFGPASLKEEELPPQTSHSTTYEELRRKNREEYELKKTKPYRGVLSPDEVPGALETRDYAQPNDPWPKPTEKRKTTNKYGDVFEK